MIGAGSDQREALEVQREHVFCTRKKPTQIQDLIAVRAMGDLSDWCPLVGAASSGKLRLVRLLVEGGAHVDGSDLRGDTALVAACKGLRRGEDGGDGGGEAAAEVLKVINYLLQNKADPNAQDQRGRTALMLACEQRATAVVSRLLRAGADPTVRDRGGASALVYAIRAQHPPTLKVILEACRAMGRDVIIVTTDPSEEATKDHLSVPPSPDSSPFCMSPSDIVLKTSAPDSPEAGSVFSFSRGAVSGRRTHNHGTSRQRGLSEPWLAIPDLTRLRRIHTHTRPATQIDNRPSTDERHPGLSPSLLPFPRLPPCPVPPSPGRRHTLPTAGVLRFPPLNYKLDVHGKGRGQTSASKISMVFPPRPPSSAPPPSSKGSVRAASLKPRVMGCARNWR